MVQKQTGAYYTPAFIADFMVRHIQRMLNPGRALTILEPSVGDGAFITALMDRNFPIGEVTAVDINSSELNKVKQKVEEQVFQSKFVKGDFLFYNAQGQSFSLVIGNPPYIKKSFLSVEQIQQCRQIHEQAGLASYSIKNIWTAFLLKSIQLLDDTGILAFVLPAELLQVKFAEELRKYLRSSFARLEILTFDNLLFECKGQDTVVLFAYKQSEERGLFFANIKDYNFDREILFQQNNFIENNQVKWNHCTLSVSELEFIYKLKNRLQPISFYCDSKPGIVTAANDYFIINAEVEKLYGLQEYTKPIIQRGLFINGSAVFTDQHYKQLEDSGKPVKIICFKDSDAEKIEKQEKIRTYLKIGEEKEYPGGYKCKKRKHWFVIPNISEPGEGLFFKRSHYYPKLVKNEANILVTDSAYKINMKNGYAINDLVYSFYNSLTLLFAELGGRHYGGGVLELTPLEFKSLPLPFIHIDAEKFADFAKEFENKAEIEEVLHKNDHEILGKLLGLNTMDISLIQVIRKKMILKRMKL